MTRDCMEIVAGEEGSLFLRECLMNGLAMGARLSHLIEDCPGEVTALLSWGAMPRGGTALTSEISLKEGLADSSAQRSLTCLTGKVQRFCADGGERIFVIEDALARRPHRFVSASGFPRLYLDDNVYWFVSDGVPGDLDSARKTVHGLRFWGAVGILTTWPLASPAVNGQAISWSTLNDLVAGVERIVVNAYDGEGFLIWYRGGWEGR